MSDFKPGDLVKVVESQFCTFGPHAENMDLVGKVGRILGFDPNDATYADLDTLPEDYICAGCCRKLNDGDGDADALERIKQCRPRIADLPRVTTPVRRLNPAIWGGVDLEGEG